MKKIFEILFALHLAVTGLGSSADAGVFSKFFCKKSESMPSLCYRGEPDYALAPNEKDCPSCVKRMQNCIDQLVSVRRTIQVTAEAVRKVSDLSTLLRKDVIDQGILAGHDGVNRKDTREAYEQMEQWQLMEAIASECDNRKKVPTNAQFICGVRLNQDLWKYKVLPEWPGCACADGKGREVGGVCLRMLAHKQPIDSRVPKTMERFVNKLKAWAKENRLTVGSMDFLGCTTVRASRHQKGCSCEQGTFGLDDVSPHGEARACDLQSVTFLDAAKKPHQFTMKDGKGFSEALKNYLVQPGVKEEFAAAVVPAKGMPERLIPTGLPDYLKIWSNIEGRQKPDTMSEADWFQLRSGVGVQRALIDAGFLMLDPFTDANHENHFHVSVPRTQSESNFMESELSDLKLRLRVVQRNRCETLKLTRAQSPLCGL